MSQKKIQKTITLFEPQIKQIQLFADEFHEGDFGRAVRYIVDNFDFPPPKQIEESAITTFN